MLTDCYERGHTPYRPTFPSPTPVLGGYPFCRKCGLTIHRVIVNEVAVWHTQAELDRLWHGVDREAVRGMSAAECSPLCGAAKAYGRFVKWWQHELDCPAREAAKVLGEEGR